MYNINRNDTLNVSNKKDSEISGMQNIATKDEIERAKNQLRALKDKLQKIKETENHGVNIFDAVGMSTQEVKHSKFLAWLLDPKITAHGLGSNFLRALIEKLLTHKNRECDSSVIPNSKILSASDIGINTIADLDDFLSDKELDVQTEKVLFDIDSRMDIFIESVKAKTVLVIENKVFTSTHDDQLERYRKQLEDREGWKKIFVYLTPKGDMPPDDGKNSKIWCVFGYQTILDIMTELLKTDFLKKKSNLRLKLLMEDYIDMVRTEILGENKEIRALCKQIRREHKDALEILLNYTDNIEEVTAYCRDWIKENIPDAVLVNNKSTFDFYTAPMKEFFVANGQSIADNSFIKCRCRFAHQDDETITMGITMQNKGADWDIAQKNMMSIFAPDKKAGNKYFSFNDYYTELLSASDRHLDFDESIKDKLNLQLSEFVNLLRKFESKLK